MLSRCASTLFVQNCRPSHLKSLLDALRYLYRSSDFDGVMIQGWGYVMRLGAGAGVIFEAVVTV